MGKNRLKKSYNKVAVRKFLTANSQKIRKVTLTRMVDALTYASEEGRSRLR